MARRRPILNMGPGGIPGPGGRQNLPGVTGEATGGRPRTNVGNNGGPGPGGASPGQWNQNHPQGGKWQQGAVGQWKAAGNAYNPALPVASLPPLPANYFPMTPGFEAGQRGIEDQLAAAEANYAAQSGLVDPWFQMMRERAGTDVGYATDALQQNMAGRGIWGSPGIYSDIYQKGIGTPYGRHMQDLAFNAAGQYSNLGSALGGAYLDYNQGLMDLLLNRASDLSQTLPLSVPQYSNQGRRRTRAGKGKGGGKGKGKGKGGK